MIIFQVFTNYKEYYLLIILVLQCTFLLSQHKISGNYLNKNFDRIQNIIGTQNHDIAELENGYILVANNSGLLIYNGVAWDVISLPNKSIVRSIATTNRGKIFVGGQDEIGYLTPGQNGNLIFQSIYEHIPSDFKPLEDIWEIKYYDEKIYFRSVNRIYTYNIDTELVEVLNPGHPIISVLYAQNNIYYHDLYRGLVAVNDTNNVLTNSDFFKFKQLVEVIEIENVKFFITETDGIFKQVGEKLMPIGEQLNKYLEESRLFSALKLSKNEIALGTQFDGIIIINPEGDIINKINKSNGLINNNVQTLLLDKGSRLWVGTSNGISTVDINSTLRKLEPDPNKSSSFYDVQLYNEKLYFASNTGLFSTDYYSNESDPQYAFIKNSQGQVWGLDVIGDDLFMGHNNGAYIISNNEAFNISDIPGAWKFLPTSKPDQMYVGTYNGIDIFKKESGRWSFEKKLEGFNESARIIIKVKPNELWVSHPYRGVYRITHDDNFNVLEVKKYGEKDGLPSSLLNYIFDLNKVPYVTGETGIYRYDRKSDKWLADEPLIKLIGKDKNVRRLIEIDENSFWFISEDETGIVSGRSGDSLSKRLYPKLVGQTVGGFENISMIDSDNAIVCTDRNVLKVDIRKSITEDKIKISINEVRLLEPHDSLLFGGYNYNEGQLTFSQTEELKLDFNHNAIVFNYSNPYHDEKTMYSFRLEKNSDGQWSSWSNNTMKEFNNLKYGNYSFFVKTKNQLSYESEPAIFSFKINPPWYFSIWAKTLYGLIILLCLAGIIIIPQKKYSKDKEVLIEAKNQSEEALEKVKNEKLKAEIDFKNAELASSTLHLVQKNETINKIRTELEAFNNDLKDRTLRKELKKVMSLMNSDKRLEDDWENFSIHFDQVHKNFLSRLSQKFPEITPKDRKLCAYLRMNLSTKEIAPLLHISVRGVEISRYRLRKKLNLEKEQNLNDFMMKF